MHSFIARQLRFGLLIILALSHLAMAQTPLDTDLGLASDSVFNNSGLPADLTRDVEFLPVDQAFQISARVTPGTDPATPRQLTISWQIAEGYYLYRHRFQFSDSRTQQAIAAQLEPGLAKHDEYFGDVEVYYQQASVQLALPDGSADQSAKQSGDQPAAPAILKVGYQGCADAGLCYPPQTLYLSIDDKDAAIFSSRLTALDSPPLASTTERGANSTVLAASTAEQGFTALLASARLPSIIGLFFLAGLALTFTPCVLPMVPIISSIVLGQGQGNRPGRARAFSLSLTYVLAMALTYALAGTLTGYFGAGLNLQLKLQSPAIIIAIAALFVAFSLSMFGLYELRLPSTLHNRLHNLSHHQRGGSYAGVALIGVISTLIVSPCVTAPLAGALVFISSTGNPVLGGTALLSLGLGMGLPLLLIGTFGPRLLPKTGQWMNQIKIFFGVLLLGVAIWMLERLLPAPVTLTLWILLLTGYAVQLGALRFPRSSAGNRSLPIMGLLLMLYSGLLAFNGLQGQYNPFTALQNLTRSTPEQPYQFQPVNNLAELDRMLQKNSARQQLVMLDIYADWCVSCQVLEQEIFTRPAISQQLGKLLVIRADITRNTPEDQALLKRFDLFGPPALLFFSADQQEIRAMRIQGEIAAEALNRHLSSLMSNHSQAPGKEISAYRPPL